MKFLNKYLWLWVFVGFVTPQLNAQDDLEVIDKIIAKIDNYIILKSDIENAYQQLLSNGESPDESKKCKLLEQLIINKVLVAKAEIDSVIVEDSQVEDELTRRMNYFVMQAGSEEKLEKTLGSTIRELKTELRDQVREQLTVQRMQGEIMAGVTITPAQVKKYFNSIPKDSIPFLSQEVKVGQIVKFPEVNRKEKEKVKAKLLELKEQLLNGADFAKLAKQYSVDYGSASRGGELGWHGRGELVPEFEATALQIDPGEIADPVESDFGFHLIQLLERRGNRFLARHILIRPKSDAQDLQNAMNALDSVRSLIVTDSISFESATKDFSDDLLTRSNAGFFKDNNTGSSYVPTESLDPVVFFTIDTMKVGNITKPLKYRTEDGKDAVRVIYYEDSNPPHYANMKDDYQKLYKAALNEKKGEILKNWIKMARRDVFIDIDPEYACDILKELN